MRGLTLNQYLPENKRMRRHARLALLSVVMLLVFFIGLKMTPEYWLDIHEPKADSVMWRASMSFAYTAILFFMVVLLIGPYYVLSQRPNPANSFLRRDIAIWAGIWCIAHAAVAMFIHVDGYRFWQSFIKFAPSLENPLPLKYNRTGLANYIGLFQLAIVVLLLLLSNNRALRTLGVKQWKNLQRLAYLAFASISVHAFLYHLVERRLWSFRLPVYIVIAIVVAGQLAGFFVVRQRRRVRQAQQPGGMTAADSDS